MALTWTWLAVLLALAAPLALGLSFLLRPPAQQEYDGILVGNVARIRALPRYRLVVRRQLVQAGVRVVGAFLILGAAILLSARPTDTLTEDPPARDGDLVICLDASPGGYDGNVQVLAQARALTGQLGRERVALMLFSDATATVLPMTDDYGYAEERFHDAQEAFQNLQRERAPTAPAKVGDGLASCADGFDRPAAERGRAVVLVSANAPGPASLYTLGEAAAFAAERDVVVYGITARGRTEAALTSFQAAIEVTGGRVFDAGDGSAAQAIDRIREIERSRLDPPPVNTVQDDPRAITFLVFAGLGLLLVAGARWQQ